MEIKEQNIIESGDKRALAYLKAVKTRRVFPDPQALTSLTAFDEPLSELGFDAEDTLALLDDIGSPATVTSNGPRYFGFVVGAALPVAAAAERLMLAWDNGAPLHLTSPACAKVEEVAAQWLVDILDLPPQSAVGFGTSASASNLVCLATARRKLLMNAGWDSDKRGLFGAPEITVVVSEKVHITVLKSLRILGFGTERIKFAQVDRNGAIDFEKLPSIDSRTIVCLQAGEVNTGEFDPIKAIATKAQQHGAWVHVDGAFGLWARASSKLKHHTDGMELADSWAVDGHKWLNTPYDCAMAICKDPAALAAAMNSDAVYANGSSTAQKNLNIEFSRRARGVPVWAALRTLGRAGVAAMIEKHCEQARELALALRDSGFEVMNRVVLNQVLVRGQDDAETKAIQGHVHDEGKVWFGTSMWDGHAAFRLSISSWRTTDDDISILIEAIKTARESYRRQRD